jgi:Zn-dependent protease with chaperone function
MLSPERKYTLRKHLASASLFALAGYSALIAPPALAIAFTAAAGLGFACLRAPLLEIKGMPHSPAQPDPRHPELSADLADIARRAGVPMPMIRDDENIRLAAVDGNCHFIVGRGFYRFDGLPEGFALDRGMRRGFAGHEIAHIANGDLRGSAAGAAGFAAMAMLSLASLVDWHNIPAYAPLGLALFLAHRCRSRQREFLADLRGAQLSGEAAGLKRFFARTSETERGLDRPSTSPLLGRLYYLAARHPSPAARLRALERAEPAARPAPRPLTA